MNENKLIAEYMGLKFDKGTMYNMGYDVFGDGNLHRTHELQYHKDWNWLMHPHQSTMPSVIDKCYQEHMSKRIADAVMTCDIDTTYKAVVEFIKEYNEYE